MEPMVRSVNTTVPETVKINAVTSLQHTVHVQMGNVIQASQETTVLLVYYKRVRKNYIPITYLSEK